MRNGTLALAAAALAALLAGGPAAAQNSGWYIGGGPGSSKAKFERGDFAGLAVGTYSVDDTDVAPRVSAACAWRPIGRWSSASPPWATTGTASSAAPAPRCTATT